jgi:hypothetical protein
LNVFLFIFLIAVLIIYFEVIIFLNLVWLLFIIE